MTVTYTFTKATRNYRRYDATNVPAGMIFGSIYLPLDDAREKFAVVVM